MDLPKDSSDDCGSSITSSIESIWEELKQKVAELVDDLGLADAITEVTASTDTQNLGLEHVEDEPPKQVVEDNANSKEGTNSNKLEGAHPNISAALKTNHKSEKKVVHSLVVKTTFVRENLLRMVFTLKI